MKRLSRIQVYGGKTLHGTITIQGSKNAALPMMAASLLHRGVSVLEVCPRISDVFCMEEILQSLGAVTWWKDHDLYLDCTRAEGTEISGIHTCRMRSSVILLGALLGRKRSRNHGISGRMHYWKKTHRPSSLCTELPGSKSKRNRRMSFCQLPQTYRQHNLLSCQKCRSYRTGNSGSSSGRRNNQDSEWGKRAGDLLALSVSSGHGSPNPGRRYRNVWRSEA